jgi:hypothetical protein
VLPGSGVPRDSLAGEGGAAGGVTQTETASGPPRVEEGSSRDPVTMDNTCARSAPYWIET